MSAQFPAPQAQTSYVHAHVPAHIDHSATATVSQSYAVEYLLDQGLVGTLLPILLLDHTPRSSDN
eukprot:6490310-Amphidinium_carterae.5